MISPLVRHGATMTALALFLLVAEAKRPSHRAAPQRAAATVRVATPPAPAPTASWRSSRMLAASALTQRYSRSAFAGWNIHAQAGGAECSVLVLTTTVILDDAMVEGLHYGGGPYDVVEGGVQQFCRAHAFRGVAYSDSSRRVWTYSVAGGVVGGDVGAEIGTQTLSALPRCR